MVPKGPQVMQRCHKSDGHSKLTDKRCFQLALLRASFHLKTARSHRSYQHSAGLNEQAALGSPFRASRVFVRSFASSTVAARQACKRKRAAYPYKFTLWSTGTRAPPISWTLQHSLRVFSLGFVDLNMPSGVSSHEELETGWMVARLVSTTRATKVALDSTSARHGYHANPSSPVLSRVGLNRARGRA